MAATATPTKPRKPPKLFSVVGDSGGIKTELSQRAKDVLEDCCGLLNLLSEAGDTFPNAWAVYESLNAFALNPTAKPGESK